MKDMGYLRKIPDVREGAPGTERGSENVGEFWKKYILTNLRLFLKEGVI